jgi:cytochrome c oxidase accessory protein FixG
MESSAADRSAGAGGAPSDGFEEVRLYERWQKIQTVWVNGRFQSLRRIVLSVLLLVFYLGPWLRWDGRQAIWIDIPARKFSILGATFWPQEFVLVAFLLVIGAFSLFVFTVLAGRLWCGYACPQTVWTLCFVWLEKMVEGDRNQRLRLDAGPWRPRKIATKGVKYALWAALAFSLGLSLLGYFSPIRELIPRVATFALGPAETFWLFFLAVASFLLHGVLREQVCLHMCPYARFQSVMFDRDTLIVSYDAERGDPRGKRRRSVDPAEAGLGSCVDCKLCVHACPTGIDIRDGLQYECIGCSACIDVCNGVMKQMGYPPDLIRYSSENEDEHAGRHWMRPRLLGYAAILLSMVGAFAFTVANRVPLDLDIIRDRNRLYRERYDGQVENVYTLKIMNREQRARSYRISAAGVIPFEYSGADRVEVAAGELRSVSISLFASPEDRSAPNTDVEFTVESDGEPGFSTSSTSRFIRPPGSGGG